VNGDPHWGYIVTAYVITFVTVGGAIWRIVGEHRRLTAELARLKDQGDES
jgi:heme exporter protein CcmD